ncbi:glycoside hydrolase family 2 TIM barrel-domain containing protein [Natrinema sp. SYSU A 869]|uniref:glycoside hydrolase family 2 TIM barrel-domain containing protein n=1 Tax=Natrinema sp. SYSU A 869 TaxID=2871694 RepID=UPI001CA3A4FD|nr:glycoside hydrolase family 2 TIM barrel-domain containing protein [Natrinema sp. SYSU A 869]
MKRETTEQQVESADHPPSVSRRHFLIASGGATLLPGLASGNRTSATDRSAARGEASGQFTLEEYIETPAMVAENQTESHVPTIPFPTVESALGGERRGASRRDQRERSPFVRSLDGEWDFLWSITPDEAPDDFDAVDEWETIDVPSVWQREGYGHALYRNVPVPMYPYDPPAVPDAINPVGTYRRTVTVPGNWTKERRTFLRFEGIKSAAFVWVNGRYVGYDQGAMTPAEFDVTEALESGKNTVAVQVYRWSDGTYLENQDMWHFAGIYRDAYLYSTPEVHLRDYDVRTDLDDDYEDATLTIDAEVADRSTEGAEGEGKGAGEREGRTSSYTLRARLFDPDDDHVATLEETVDVPVGERVDVALSTDVSDPRKWSAEHPHLYRLGFELAPAGSNNTTEAQLERVGFREYEIIDGQIHVNGESVAFRGVNRHEHDPVHGRTMTTERIREDLELMKRFNVNAVRTSHYPNDPEFAALADEYGLYVQDEVNAETHQNEELVTEHREFDPSFMDRFRRMIQRDKNHPSIFTWSTGNEAGLGPVHFEMADYATEVDDTRFLYHQANNGGDAPFAPIVGPRYVSPDELEEIAQSEDEERPVIMGEYSHAMGNSLGLMESFWELVNEYDQLQGGFVWDWVDQTLFEDLIVTPDESGHGNDGTLHGNPSVVETDRGSALALSGLDDWVELYRDPSLDITKPGLTVEAVVKPREPWTGADPFVTKGDTQYALQMADEETIEWFVYDSDEEWVTASAAVPDDWIGSWHHVAGVHTGSELRLYVDGELLDATEHTGSINHAHQPVSIGRNAELHTDGYEGWLSNAVFKSVRISDRALSPAELESAHAGASDDAVLDLSFEEFRDEGTYRTYGASPFCINGTIFADRTPQPELWDLKKAHQPVGIDPVDPAAGIVSIDNRFHFTSLSALETTWRLTDGETVLQDGTLSLEADPGETEEVTVPFDEPDLKPGAEYWLTISVALAEDARWADAGHEIAFEQFAVPFDVPHPPLEAVESMPSITVER